MPDLPEEAVEALKHELHCGPDDQREAERLTEAAAPHIRNQRDEELRERLEGNEAVEALYEYVPVIESDDDAGPSDSEAKDLRLALEMLAVTIFEEADGG